MKEEQMMLCLTLRRRMLGVQVPADRAIRLLHSTTLIRVDPLKLSKNLFGLTTDRHDCFTL